LLLLVCCAAAVWLSGTVQTAIYCDFFYYYIKAWKNNEKLALPS
jgi:ER lumen protein retaining receptor